MLANASLFDSRPRAPMATLPWHHVPPKNSSYLTASDEVSHPWQSSSSSWSIDSQYSSPYSHVRQPVPVQTHPAAASDFPESSQRTVIASSMSPSAIPLPIGVPYTPSHRMLPPHPSDSRFLNDTSLYTIDDDADASLAVAARKTSPFVKVEQDELSTDTFVFETTPPVLNTMGFAVAESQVPLRATQASKEMRRMMGVFRLNPFAVQGGNGSLNAPIEEAKPLAEEGRIFEFQLTSTGLVAPASPPGHHRPAPHYEPTEDTWVGRDLSPESAEASATDAASWGYSIPADVAAQYPLLAPASFDLESASTTRPSRVPMDQHYAGHHNRGFASPQGTDTRSMRPRRTSSDAAHGDALRRYVGSPGMSSRPTTSGSYPDSFETHDRYVTSPGVSASSFDSLPRHSSMSRRALDHTSNSFFT